MMDDNKIINISGVNNRYQIKKMINENKARKNRVLFNNYMIHENDLTYSNQLELLQKIKNNYIETREILNDDTIKLLSRELEKKISSYKQQDLIKKLYCDEKFITLYDVISKLLECNMKCYYCSCEMYILYKIVRETKQWTVDRINNDIGHNIDNYVVACLECNLKRRRKNCESFLFTKQLNINKLEK
jgi:glutaredoxin-related protein